MTVATAANPELTGLASFGAGLGAVLLACRCAQR